MVPILRFLIAMTASAVIAHSRNAAQRIVSAPFIPVYNPPKDVSFTSPPPTDLFRIYGIPVRSSAIAIPPAMSMQNHLIRSPFPAESDIFEKALPIKGTMVLKLIAFGIRRVRKSNPAAAAMTTKNKTS